MAARRTNDVDSAESDVVKQSLNAQARHDAAQSRTSITKPTGTLPVEFWMATNLFSSIALVLLNKQLTLPPYKFKYVLTLTVVHFGFTYAGLGIAVAMGLVQFKKLSFFGVLPISAAFSGFVALTNVSLRHNSVGVYQIFKILTSPTIVCIEYIFYSKVVDAKLLFALALVCIGAGYTSISDVEFNFRGTVIAAIATVVTSCYQIWTNTTQKTLKCSSSQLLLYQVPISSMMIIALIPSQEEPGLLDAAWDFQLVALIMLTGVLAFLVNLSTFLVIGSTSAITYNVLGHLKRYVSHVNHICIDAQVCMPAAVSLSQVTSSFLVVWPTSTICLG
jgi:solute carrier family 35 protein E3